MLYNCFLSVGHLHSSLHVHKFSSHRIPLHIQISLLFLECPIKLACSNQDPISDHTLHLQSLFIQNRILFQDEDFVFRSIPNAFDSSWYPGSSSIDVYIIELINIKLGGGFHLRAFSPPPITLYLYFKDNENQDQKSEVTSQGHPASTWQLLSISLFILLNQELANFFCEGQKINILGFVRKYNDRNTIIDYKVL